MAIKIPLPWKRGTTITDLAKTSKFISEAFSIGVVVRSIIFLVIIGILLFVYLGFPVWIVLLLIITNSFSLVVKYLKAKTFYSLPSTNDGKTFKEIFVKGEYYDLIGAVILFIANILIAVIVILFFKESIAPAASQAGLSSYLGNIGSQLDALVSMLNLTSKTELFQYAIFIFVVFHLFDLIVKYIKYASLKGIDETKNIAQVSQDISFISKKLELVKAMPSLSAVLFILFYMGVPAKILSIFFGILIVIVVLSIIELKRIKAVDLSEASIQKEASRQAVKKAVYPGEQIAGAVFGVLSSQRTGFSFLGAGKMKRTENSILITNKRLLLITVPVTGGSNIVAGTAWSDTDFFWNRGEIREKGTNMINTMSLQQLLDYASLEIPYDQIQKVHLKNFRIAILTKDNKKFKYTYMDKEYNALLNNTLRQYLSENVFA